MRIKALFSLAALGFASLALAQAQNVVVEEKKSETVTVVVRETPKPPDWRFEFHGFISSQLFFQDANYSFGNGQNALIVAQTYTADKPIFGADIRQSRFSFSMFGPKVMGDAQPKAYLEFDLFGSSEFLPTGGFGDVSVLPRIRVAYAELNWGAGRHILQFGQQNMLTVGIIPQSLSHIAFPTTYAAGTVGWRQPGIFGWHTFGDDLKFEFAWSVQKAGWAANQNVNTVGPCTTGTTPAAVTGAPTVTCTGTPSNATVYGGIAAGVASGLPAFELRGKVIMGAWEAWISGHWQNNDFNGPGVIANDVLWSNRQTILGTFGFKGALGPVALSGSAWYGKNAGPLLGNIVQFTPANYAGDIFGWGGWAQGGFNFTKQMSLWYTFGIDIPQFQDILGASSYNTPGSTVALFKNMNQTAMLRYAEGGFMLGLEYMYTRTYSVKNADNPAIGQQISFSANYFF